jgi:hypothetical protein
LKSGNLYDPCTGTTGVRLLGYDSLMRFTILVLAHLMLVAVSPGRASADQLTVATLVDACKGGQKRFDEAYRSLTESARKAIDRELLDHMRQQHREAALLTCAMYLSGSLDQIIFFFDKHGMFDGAEVICIPPTHYEVATSLRDILTHRLLAIPKKDLARIGTQSAKSWVATTMLQLFPCATPTVEQSQDMTNDGSSSVGPSRSRGTAAPGASDRRIGSGR